MQSPIKIVRLVTVLWLCVLVWLLLSAFYNHEPSVTLPFNSNSFEPSRCPRPVSGTVRPPDPGMAAAVTPAELMCRPLASDLAIVPKLFHQSWVSTELPAKFERWSNACREKHPDWEWVLWTDEDNMQLVQKYFPWLEDTYLSLPGNIYRVDLARNLYMYLFGGVYADLDTECLRSTSDALDVYSLTDTDSESAPDDGPRQVAFLGRMGNDSTFEHHTPNAWMAASPGHPFFLQPLESARAEIAKSRWPLHQLWYDYPSAEQMTGPIALGKIVQNYKSSAHDDIILLPEHLVYPFDWNTDEGTRAVCSAEQDTFDDGRCKELLDVDSKKSLSITYWSHTHRGTGTDATNIDHISHDD